MEAGTQRSGSQPDFFDYYFAAQEADREEERPERKEIPKGNIDGQEKTSAWEKKRNTAVETKEGLNQPDSFSKKQTAEEKLRSLDEEAFDLLDEMSAMLDEMAAEDKEELKRREKAEKPKPKDKETKEPEPDAETMTTSISFLPKRPNEEANAVLQEASPVSYVHAIRKFGRIVLASDSRAVRIKDGSVVGFSDTVQKIVYLPKLGMAVAAAGEQPENLPPICEYLLSIDKAKAAYEDLSARLKYVSGCVYRMYQPKAMSLVGAGFNDGRDQLLVCELKAGKSVWIRDAGSFWSSGSTVAPMLYDKYRSLNADLKSMKDVLDFSEFLVNTEISLSRFKPGIPFVGGTVQELILEKDGYTWVKKPY